MESSPSPCKLDHGGLEPNAVAIYEEVMYRMLPLIHSSHFGIMCTCSSSRGVCDALPCVWSGVPSVRLLFLLYLFMKLFKIIQYSPARVKL